MLRLSRGTAASFHQGLFALLFVAVTIPTTHAVAEKPTREQIVAFAAGCKQEQKRMELVAEFGLDFSGLDLSGVDFRGYYAVGYETNIRDANFSNSNLAGAEFGAAILDGADFTGANLDRATFITASLKKTRLANVSLKGTKFYLSDLSGANLANADLSSADITGSRFAETDLSNAVLAGAKNEYWWSDFGKANLTGANLSGLNLNGARFQNAVLRSTDLTGAQLIQADFASAELADASFNNANVDSAVFRGARGLDDVEKNKLESQAQRWKFDLKTATVRLLAAAYFPTYVVVILALIGLSFRVLRFPNRSRPVTVAAVVNLLAFAPACLMVCMFVVGAHPTVQFNVGSRTAMEAWSAWVHLWPLLMLLLIGCVSVSMLVALVFLASHFRGRALKQAKLPFVYVILTVLHCLFAAHWIGENFPSA